MAEKRFYWLKLKDDYFNNPKIKKLRKIAGGDTFTIIYLKMQLLSVSNKGIIEFEGIEPTFEEELALKLDEELDNVTVTLNYLKLQGLIESNNNEFLILDACKNIGSECDSAERVRVFREKEKQKALQCNGDVTTMLQNSISISSYNSNIYNNNGKIINEIVNKQPEELQNTLLEFLKMRKTIKKPMTPRAVEMLINKLNKISDKVQIQVKVLEQSILHCWQDVYELKDNDRKTEKKENIYEQLDRVLGDM
jgi:predicted phage replisome organizer